MELFFSDSQKRGIADLLLSGSAAFVPNNAKLSPEAVSLSGLPSAAVLCHTWQRHIVSPIFLTCMGWGLLPPRLDRSMVPMSSVPDVVDHHSGPRT